MYHIQLLFGMHWISHNIHILQGKGKVNWLKGKNSIALFVVSILDDIFLSFVFFYLFSLSMWTTSDVLQSFSQSFNALSPIFNKKVVSHLTVQAKGTFCIQTCFCGGIAVQRRTDLTPMPSKIPWERQRRVRF